MKLDKEFKQAISELPSKEKDKLILRLCRRDHTLAKRLYFELVSDQTVDENRDEMEIRVKNQVENMTRYFHSPGDLMMHMRYLSGEITSHVKTTKDKFGDASLNLLMLVGVLRGNNENIRSASPARSAKCCLYIIARAFKILILVKALAEDYFIEFENQLMELGRLIGENDALMQTAIRNGFDVNWLLVSGIPDDIHELHKELRNQGFLTS